VRGVDINPAVEDVGGGVGGENVVHQMPGFAHVYLK